MSPARMLLAAIAGFFLAAALAPAPAAARTGYDGNWSVLIVTNSGSCDRAYRYGVSIRNGRVFYEGSAAVNVDGSVSGKGYVRVRVWAGSQSASGSGRLSSNYGSGSWRGQGSAASCAGTWTAERR